MTRWNRLEWVQDGLGTTIQHFRLAYHEFDALGADFTILDDPESRVGPGWEWGRFWGVAKRASGEATALEAIIKTVTFDFSVFSHVLSFQ